MTFMPAFPEAANAMFPFKAILYVWPPVKNSESRSGAFETSIILTPPGPSATKAKLPFKTIFCAFVVLRKPKNSGESGSVMSITLIPLEPSAMNA